MSDKYKFKKAKKMYLKQKPIIHYNTTLDIDTHFIKNEFTVVSTIPQMINETGHRWLIEFMKNCEYPLSKR